MGVRLNRRRRRRPYTSSRAPRRLDRRSHPPKATCPTEAMGAARSVIGGEGVAIGLARERTEDRSGWRRDGRGATGVGGGGHDQRVAREGLERRRSAVVSGAVGVLALGRSPIYDDIHSIRKRRRKDPRVGHGSSDR